MAHFAGIDLGTTAVKGCVVDELGRVHRRSLRQLDLSRPQPGWCEQDADSLLAATQSVLDELWPFEAAAVAGQINTHILVDAEGSPLAPAISWSDRRAVDYADAHWGASSLVARYRWWRANRAEMLKASTFVLLPRDYVLFRLTGHAVTDADSWPDMTEAGRWRTDAPAGLRGLLPEIKRPMDLAGTYRGSQLVVGCMDSVAAIVGCGTTTPGMAIDVSGSSETVGVVSATSEHVSAIRSAPEIPGGFWHAGPTQAGSRSLDWIAALLAPGLNVSEVLALASDAHPTPTGLIFLPYLDGERAPLWDPALRGALVGLNTSHGAGDVVRAVLEGVAFAVRHIIDVARPPSDPAPGGLVICGGGARSSLWNQIKADATGLTAKAPTDWNTGASGAAMIAAASASGLSLERVQETMAPPSTQYTPDGGSRAAYDQLYAVYRDVAGTLTQSSHHLSNIRRQEA